VIVHEKLGRVGTMGSVLEAICRVGIGHVGIFHGTCHGIAHEVIFPMEIAHVIFHGGIVDVEICAEIDEEIGENDHVENGSVENNGLSETQETVVSDEVEVSDRVKSGGVLENHLVENDRVNGSTEIRHVQEIVHVSVCPRHGENVLSLSSCHFFLVHVREFLFLANIGWKVKCGWDPPHSY